MNGLFFYPFSGSLRERVAYEAALLLYTSQEKEYKQSKERAASLLGTSSLPTNFEVAKQLDLIAQEREGREREERLVRMRREALMLMESLKDYSPKLIGSVWRGTAHINSDIDIEVSSTETNDVVNNLERQFMIVGSQRVVTTRLGQRRTSIHLDLRLSSGDKAEVIIKEPITKEKPEICSIYGDPKTGLTPSQLDDVLKRDPLQRFVPKKRFLSLR